MKKLLGSVLMLLFFPALSFGYTRIVTPPNSGGPGGTPVKPASSTVLFVLNDKINTSPNIVGGGSATDALNAARQEWNQIATSAVSFAPFTTTTESIAKNDNQNIITFSDGNQFTSGSDTLAITLILFGVSSGTIRDEDIVFNPNAKFFVNPGTEGYDIQSVATHEMGHALGADHTAVLSATMYQSSGQLEFFQRTLDPDDVAFASATYPIASRPLGSISGKVLSGGAAVFGAHVVAYDAAKNIYLSGVSLKDGSYTIDGLPPGNYVIYAEPFDGPVTLSSLFSGNVNAFFANSKVDFISSTGASQALAAGQAVQNADISVPSGTATVNITSVGRNFLPPTNSAGSFFIGGGPLQAGPGQSFTLVALGDGITEAAIDSGTLKLEIEGSGVTIQGRGKLRFTSGKVGAFVDLQIAADAQPGPRQVRVVSGDQKSYYTAGLVIAEQNITQRALRFPAVQQSSSEFTGIGITNLSANTAVIRALYYDSTGKLISIPGIRNPSSLSIPPNNQLARLSQEIFEAVRQESGWVELQSDQDQVYAFFLSGDSTLNRLDGTDVPRTTLTNGIFVDVRQNATFETEFDISNNNDVAVTLTFEYVGATGQKVSNVTRVVAPRASFRETAQQLFSGINSDVGYVTFKSTLPVNAVELVRSATSLVSLNAQDLSAGSGSIVSSHFAVGNAGLVFFSKAYVVNPGNSIEQVIIEGRNSSGALLNSPPFPLSAQQIVELRLAEIFNIVPGGPAVIGSVTLKTLSGNPIFASLLFGDTFNNQFASEIPFESVAGLGKDLVFEQLATTVTYYTGLSVYFPGTGSTQVTIEVRNPAGALLGSVDRTLQANTKLTDLISNLVPGAVNQAGGYIRVKSTQPVSAVVLFGTNSGSVLAAVPASRVQ
ncbi:MAG TPA: matrixin family metalloprotease [Acidobacteriota bacterium]|jgi:hypothetical protein